MVPIGWAYYSDYQYPPEGGGQVIPEWMIHYLKKQGCDMAVLGCTELPIAFSQCALEYSVADPTQILAEAAVAFAGYPVKKLY